MSRFRPRHFRPSTFRPIGFRPMGPEHGYRVYKAFNRTGPYTLAGVYPPGSSSGVAGLFANNSDQLLHMTAVSPCGVEDNEVPKQKRARFDASGNYLPGVPNAPSNLTLVRAAAGSIEVSWQYFDRQQEAEPANFNVYVALDAAEFNFGSAEDTVAASAPPRRYTTTIGPYSDGQLVRVIVRAETSGGDEEPNYRVAQISADAAAPDAPASVAATVEVV